MNEQAAETETPGIYADPKRQEPTPMNKGWYIIHTQSGFEDKVKRILEEKIQSLGLAHKIFSLLIPTEEVVEVVRSKKVVRKRKFFPGYVMVEMVVDNETYWFVKGVPGVTGFLGEPKPTALPESEVKGILDLTRISSEAKPKPAVQFEKGENVRISDGPFRHFIGVVEECNDEKAKLKAMVTIFGRPTPVELDYLQVEKL